MFVYICLPTYIYICTYRLMCLLQTYVNIHIAYIHTYMHTSMHMYNVHPCTHIPMKICLCTYIHTCICTYICMYAWMYVICVCMYIHTCLPTYIHICINTYLIYAYTQTHVCLHLHIPTCIHSYSICTYMLQLHNVEFIFIQYCMPIKSSCCILSSI